jgi:hypothetical protein
MAVVKNVASVLVHTPGMVVHGSKPSREISKDAYVKSVIEGHLRDYDKALAYPPNQVFIGNVTPFQLQERPKPWFDHQMENALRYSPHGEIMPEDEFLALMQSYDKFQLIWLEEGFAESAYSKLKKHELFRNETFIPTAKSLAVIEKEIANHAALPIYYEGAVVGCSRQGHDEDDNLTSQILFENLAAKASGALSIKYLLRDTPPESIQYVINCGEEAVGDRYQRGGGNLGKAMAEVVGCGQASGSDVKAFCCAPIHAIVVGASLVDAGVYDHVIVVGGGCLAKLGMKYLGHVKNNMPILEDVLAGIAIHIGKDDGVNPIIRLDVTGKHTVTAGSSPQAITEVLVGGPLNAAGYKVTDIDRFAVEMHNPEVTEPSGSSNVPKTNYRMIGALGVIRGEVERTELNSFEQNFGMPGFSPTQGHIAAAIPYLVHAWRDLAEGKIKRAMFIAKGSLFLGKMTELSDGMSIIVEQNPALLKGGDHQHESEREKSISYR